MARTPEAVIKDKVKAFLKAKGVWFFMPVSNGMGAMGVPDLICCANGRFVAIEVKAPGKRNNTTVLQDKQIMGIHQAGGVAVVVDDVRALEGIFE
jgi:Holliday junction resolvase